MKDKTCLISGATQGIGFEAAKALAAKGATTVIAGRDERRTALAAEKITAATGNKDVSYLVADFSSLEDVRRFARDFTNIYPRLDVLVNNAGGMTRKRNVTKDGFEMCWGLNHLSYFLLTNELLPLLKKTGTDGAKSRIVNVASNAHFFGTIDFDDLQREKKYKQWEAYGQSKLANIMFTFALARRLEGSNVVTNCLHPGVVGTGFIANMGVLEKLASPIVKLFLLSPEEGAKTTIYLASAPDAASESGRYFAKQKLAKSSEESRDEVIQERLWEISAEQVGI